VGGYSSTWGASQRFSRSAFCLLRDRWLDVFEARALRTAL